MNQDMIYIASKMHLIHDEIEEFPGLNGHVIPFRVRVWRASGDAGEAIQPVVLVSQVSGQIHPTSRSIKIANYAWQALCGYHQRGIRYFQSGRDLSGYHLQEVHFEIHGYCGKRPLLFAPLTEKRLASYVSGLVGEEVSILHE